jgi:putative flippase GtrA
LLFVGVVQHRERITAGIGGGIATAVDVTTLVLLVHAGVAVAPAAFLGSAVGAVACFVWNKHVAFRDRSRITWRQLVRFGVVAVATALLMAFAMHVVAVKLGVPVVPAKLACSAAVFLAWTFPAQRRLVFAHASRSYS